MMKRLLTMTIALLSVVGVWADETTVSSATTWTFGTLSNTTTVTVSSTDYTGYNSIAETSISIPGLYVRANGDYVYSQRSLGSSETITFYDGTTVDVDKVLRQDSKVQNYNKLPVDATSTYSSGTNGLCMMAITTTCPGTLYVALKSTSTTSASNAFRIYHKDTHTNGDNPVLNSAKNLTTDGNLQYTYYTSTQAGTFFFGDLTNPCDIYAVRFVPHTTINTAKTWVFNNIKNETYTATIGVGEGLYLRGKSANVTAGAETSYTSHTFTGESASTISKSLTLGYLANDATSGVAAYAEEYFRGTVAFEAGVAGKITAVMSNSSGNARFFSSTSTTAYLQESTTSDPKEHSVNVPKGTVFVCSKANGTKLYAMRFVPEEITAPSIKNNNGTITITAGTSNIGATVNTYYTTDGSEPTSESTEYTGTFSQAIGCPIKAITISSLGTSSTVAEKTVPTIPTALSSKTLNFAGLTTSDVTVDDVSNYDDGTYQTNSSSASAIYVKDVTFCYSKTGASFSLETNYLNTSSTGVSITIPGLTAGNIVVAKLSSVSSTTAATISCTGGTILAGAETSKNASVEANASTLIVNSTGGNMVLTNAGAGVRVFSLTIANTLSTSVAGGQTSMGSAVVTTEPLITETNYFTTGSSVTVTATPNTGYRFVKWKNGDADVSTDAAYTFDLNEDVALTANFAKSDLALSDGSGENGTITFKKGEDVVTTAQVGDEVTIVVTPATGYQLQDGTLAANYNDGEAKTADISESKFTMPAYAVSVGATFEAINYTITYDLAEGTVESDNPTSYTIETASFTLNNPTKVGCTFAGWKLNGEGDPQTTVTITQGSTGNLSYTATWSTDTYTLTLPEASNGNSITTTKTTDLTYNEAVTLTITTADDYTLKSISAIGGASLSGTGDTRTFTMPASDVTIKAVWEEKTAESAKTEVTENVTITDAYNAEVSSVEVGAETTSITISGTVSDGTNDVPVTSIAEGTFTAENTAKVQSIDLSNTQVALSGDVRSSGVLSAIPENTIIYLPQQSNTATGKNVVVTSDGTNFTCADFEMDGGNSTGKSYSVPKPFTAASAKLSREFPEEVAATVCLPYALTQGQANALGKFYLFKSVSGSTVTMEQVTSGGLESNKPYMFMPNSTTGSNGYVEAANVEVSIANSQTSGETGGGAFTFEGVIADKTFTADEISGGIYGFAAEAAHGASSVGQFVKATSGAYVKAFRAYLVCSTELTGENHSASRGIEGGDALPDTLNVVLVNADGSTTNIGKLELIDTDDNTPRYNLSGQRVDKSYKGIVIINGKKVVIK